MHFRLGKPSLGRKRSGEGDMRKFVAGIVVKGVLIRAVGFGKISHFQMAVANGSVIIGPIPFAEKFRAGFEKGESSFRLACFAQPNCFFHDTKRSRYLFHVCGYSMANPFMSIIERAGTNPPSGLRGGEDLGGIRAGFGGGEQTEGGGAASR